MIFSLPALPTNYSLLSAVALALLTIAGMQVFKDEIAMEGNLWRLALGGFVGSWFFVFILTVCQWNHVHCTDPLGGNSVYVTDSITTCNSAHPSPSILSQAVGNVYTLLFTADYAQVKLFPEGTVDSGYNQCRYPILPQQYCVWWLLY